MTYSFGILIFDRGRFPHFSDISVALPLGVFLPYQHSSKKCLRYKDDLESHRNVTLEMPFLCMCANFPDLSCIDFFWWGQMKSWVYETPVLSVEDFPARTSVAAIKLSEMPGIFHCIRNSM